MAIFLSGLPLRKIGLTSVPWLLEEAAKGEEADGAQCPAVALAEEGVLRAVAGFPALAR